MNRQTISRYNRFSSIYCSTHTFDEGGELFACDVAGLQVDVQSEQQSEYDSVSVVETAYGLMEHFISQALLHAVDALQQDL